MSNEPYIGTWYVIVTCENCKSTVYLFQDLTNGKGSLDGTFLVTCPDCDYKGEYEGRHYQRLPNGAGVTLITHDNDGQRDPAQKAH